MKYDAAIGEFLYEVEFSIDEKPLESDSCRIYDDRGMYMGQFVLSYPMIYQHYIMTNETLPIGKILERS